ncbi:LEA type 2 family protein [Pyxidicoccus sp. MSG2]|uniref:LEA type 2 family protein n=1 Tax=Pyxidicoccus sp. MSG2 TaxID=2996790 RepID=UPI00226ECA1E|nr:LEA type 2 family protein [Pyxidicoccus sp. MSG2]MCY1019186.1 LEA type 2 family protein [Pyxidicoccus sp. MSG2]
MPKMKRALLVLAVLSFTTLTGCAALQNLLKGAFKKPTLTFKTARLSSASLSDATVDLVYEVNNPNSFGLDLASVDYSFFVEGKQVVAGKPKKGLSLKKNGKSELVFPANVKFADIVPVVETFLNKDKAAYKAEGSVGIKTPIGVLNFPLSKEGAFEVPKIPQVSFQAPRIKGISGTTATVEFPLEIKNRNSFPLPVAGITGALKVGGANVGNLSTGNLGLLDGSGTKQVTLPLTINLLSAASAAMALRSGGSAQVKLDGKLTSDSQSVPLNLSQLLNFVK